MTAAKKDSAKVDKPEAKDGQVADPQDEAKVADAPEAKTEEVPTEPEVKDEDAKPQDEKVEEALTEDDEDEDVWAEPSGTTVEEDADRVAYDAPHYVLPGDSVTRTSDSDDVNKSWTAQENDLSPLAPEPDPSSPGQTFSVDELPDPEVVEGAGINFRAFASGLPVRDRLDNEAPRKGIPA